MQKVVSRHSNATNNVENVGLDLCWGNQYPGGTLGKRTCWLNACIVSFLILAWPAQAQIPRLTGYKEPLKMGRCDPLTI